MTRPRFFATPEALRAWFEEHHKRETEVLVGFYKRDSGKPSITWPESVDEALSFGWIDGVRRTIDEISYTIRFTPRKSRSNWSAINVRRMAELMAQGRVRPAGLAAFEKRSADQAPSYRRVCAWWVVSAKKEETRRSRLATLISDSARGRKIPSQRRPGD